METGVSADGRACKPPEWGTRHAHAEAGHHFSSWGAQVCTVAPLFTRAPVSQSDLVHVAESTRGPHASRAHSLQGGVLTSLWGLPHKRCTPPPLRKHQESLENHGHTGSWCLDKAVLPRNARYQMKMNNCTCLPFGADFGAGLASGFEMAQLQPIGENGFSHGGAQLVIRNCTPRFGNLFRKLCM